MPFSTSMPKNPQADKLAALKAAREKAASGSSENPAAITKWISPGDCKDRTRIVFDDSHSMSGKNIEDARQGTIEYMRNCIPNQTAVAVHFLSTKSDLENLNSNLIEIASKLKDTEFNMGETPLFHSIMTALDLKPQLTRMVVFTDGSPTDNIAEMIAEKSTRSNRYLDSADVIISKAKERVVPIDTIFFGRDESYTTKERELLKYIADGTGGFFMIFDPANVNFRTAFKYLAPVNRLMLASESVRKEIESGKRS